MIVTKYHRVRSDGVALYLTYSDKNRYIVRNDGVEYEQAIDIAESGYLYTETDKKIEVEPEDSSESIMV